MERNGECFRKPFRYGRSASTNARICCGSSDQSTGEVTLMSETIFFNMWQTDSPESREALVSAMRSETSTFAAKPGFRSLTVWAGEESDYRVLAEGRWASKDHFDAAVANNPETITARTRMEKLGRSAPGLFSERFRLDSPAPTNATNSTVSSEILLETVEHRWNALGFKSSMINVNGVDLHVVSGGKGSPVEIGRAHV